MLVHWIWLATRPILNAGEKAMLLRHFGDPEEVFYADLDACKELNLPEKKRTVLKDKELSEAEAIQRACRRNEIHILTCRDAVYPSKLKNIADPPLVLYYKGILPDFDSVPVIGIVGTRKASAYGLTVAKRMGYQIGKCGALVVSGGAEGIDGLAMRGALSAGTQVVGVLGCGVDIVYPPTNGSLFADVQGSGCLISEYPPGTPPFGYNFPKRNRIISGLSDGVLVVEAPKRSGALITANEALQQGRAVYAVPGNIGVESTEGTNALLKDGATPVTCGWDVLAEYEKCYPGKIQRYEKVPQMSVTPEELQEQASDSLAKVAQNPILPGEKRVKNGKADKKGIDKGEQPPYIDGSDMPELTPQEKALAELLKDGERSIDALAEASGMPSALFMATMTSLELQGVVVSLPGKRAALKKQTT